MVFEGAVVRKRQRYPHQFFATLYRNFWIIKIRKGKKAYRLGRKKEICICSHMT
jgi:hypothetical protein